MFPSTAGEKKIRKRQMHEMLKQIVTSHATGIMRTS